MGVFVFVKLTITAQPGPVLLVTPNTMRIAGGGSAVDTVTTANGTRSIYAFLYDYLNIESYLPRLYCCYYGSSLFSDSGCCPSTVTC